MTTGPGLDAVPYVEPMVSAAESKALDAPAPASNLAQLLDSFTAAFNNPERETVGSFAATLEALHGELTLLARHFGAGALVADSASDEVDFDDIFPEAPATTEVPCEPAIAPAE